MILLLIAFYGFMVLKQQTKRSCEKYPPATDCKSIKNIFRAGEQEVFKEIAILDYENTL
jgi:hypothetical protein